MKGLKQKYLDWLKLRKESKDVDGDMLCYCAYTKHCDCNNPTLDIFKEAVKNGKIVLGDKNNGWTKIL